MTSLSAPDLIIEIALLLLVVFTPIPNGTFNGWPVMVVHVLSFVLLISWLVKIREHKSWRPRKTPVDYPVILFFMAALISFTFSLDHGKSLAGVLKLFDCLIIFYVVANTLNTKKKVKILIYSIILVGSFISMFGLIQFIGGIERSWWLSRVELSATFENSNYFAGYIAMIIPLAIGMFFDDQEPGQKIIISYLLIIMILAFILSLSRGGWISLATAIVVMSLLFLNKSRGRSINIRWLPIITIFSITAFLLIFLGFNNITNKFSITMKNKDYTMLNGRVGLWKHSLVIIKDYPFIGAGIDVFTSFNSPIPDGFKNIAYTKYIKKGLLSSYQGYDGMELCNEYLQLSAEMGIIGLLCFIWLIIKGALGSLKIYAQKRDKFKQILCLGIIGGEIATVIHMLSSNILNFMSNSILLSILMGIIFGRYCLSKPHKERIT